MTLRRIGAGFCGSVWAAPFETPIEEIGDRAIKREDGGPERSLYNDYIMHQQILSALPSAKIPPRIFIPDFPLYIEEYRTSSWSQLTTLFPKEFQIPCNVLVTDRIFPFAEAVRYKIIEAYCPESLQDAIKASEPDQDCLVRIYLGRRRRLERQSRFKPFSLRNYPLHIDQMEDMQLDVTLYARVMAETLAFLYWTAQVDANDVEFVLAPPPSVNDKDPTTIDKRVFESEILGEHSMWILDFDCCRPITMDEAGVHSAVWAFCRNDPYFPCPAYFPRRGAGYLQDQDLWKTFRNAFLEASWEILGRDSEESRLPAMWVRKVESWPN